MTEIVRSRRHLVLTGAIAGLAGLALAGCRHDDDGGEVTANEDLMREHGIIRRALFVYAEVARRARKDPASVPLSSIADTAKLFRAFAEDYHERGLEETHIFPVVRKLATPVAKLPDILLAQHQRGREITDYVLRVAGGSSLAPAEAERFAATLDGFVAMYGPHAAHEDTELFPVWKATLGPKGYDEIGDQFEELEHKMFGHDGFKDALARISRIEQAFGLGGLSALTPPAPPPA